MDKVARFPARQRSELFSETAAQKNTTPAIVEKDFWVTWVLGRLFLDPSLARLLIFKGGTSLSKAYNLIERFSEDIDLILDWRVLGGDDPLAERSRNKQDEINKGINKRAINYIGGELLGMVRMALGNVCECSVGVDNPFVIDVKYPAAFPDEYLRPEIRLEIGPLAAWLPHGDRSISCYAAEVFPDKFDKQKCVVRVIRAERTFWEKATILHHEAHRPEESTQPARYSRHYYDLFRMARSPVREQALADFELLADVAAFKQQFYPRGWARYDLAKPGTLVLVPQGHVLDSINLDYPEMKNMIFGEAPDFDEILAVLQRLQEEINS